jgi:hypothetical protein
MEIDYSGKVSILGWESNMSVWKALYTEHEHGCNMYGYCGPYGYCDNTETVPGTCKCLDGFEPRDEKGWIARSKVLAGMPPEGGAKVYNTWR